MSSDEGDEVDFCHLLRKKNLSSIWPQKSVFVVEEIINTEQAYVTDLENIVKVSIVFVLLCPACVCMYFNYTEMMCN